MISFNLLFPSNMLEDSLIAPNLSKRVLRYNII